MTTKSDRMRRVFDFLEEQGRPQRQARDESTLDALFEEEDLLPENLEAEEEMPELLMEDEAALEMDEELDEDDELMMDDELEVVEPVPTASTRGRRPRMTV
jgi:hypothetical protein